MAIGEAYTCDVCKGQFKKTTSEEEANEESRRLWGIDGNHHDAGIVCDDCFKEFKQWWDILPRAERRRMEREQKRQYQGVN